MKQPPFFKSFEHAVRGVRLALRTERSFRIQMGVSLVILALLVMLPLKSWERVMILFVTMFVLVLELINSSLERLMDLLKPRWHESAGDIKDLMAGAVLLASVFVAMIGVLLLSPYLMSMLSLV